LARRLLRTLLGRRIPPVPFAKVRLVHLQQDLQRLPQLPALGRMEPPQPLEPGARIERRPVSQTFGILPGDLLVHLQQLLQAADLLPPPRAQPAPRLGLVARPVGDLAPPHRAAEAWIVLQRPLVMRRPDRFGGAWR